ncbi:uncharacterized protein LOC142520138 isoform X1 [Primulina tabacum]|uniref:uncharacterized protein LOC142520138 isoform X1 n=1 Tax=Primulina tabacum TaxID=48773 RepID=UPI003F59D5CD
MINGDGVEEKVSSAIIRPFDTQFDQESEGGDELSHYSSCGESEFEKYCSACSAMGTPSFRSSSYQGSDFGSLKSFKLGSESTSFKNFGDNKILSNFSGCTSSDKETQSSSDGKGNGMSNGRIEGFVMRGIDVLGNYDVDDNWGNEGVNMNIGVRNCEEGTEVPGSARDVEGVKGCYRGTKERDDEGGGLEIVGGKGRKLSDEGEALSSYDHSDGDDSMFGCGSDDGGEIDSYYGNNMLFHVDESGKNENQLVMNSKVAFGSNDWDDFIQENGGHFVPSVAWNEFRVCTQGAVDSLNLFATDSVEFPLPQAEARSTSVACDKVQPACKPAEIRVSSLSTNSINHGILDGRVADVKEVLVSRNQVSDMDELTEYLKRNSNCDAFEPNKDALAKKGLAKEDLKIHLAKSEMKHQYKNAAISSDVSVDGKVAKTNTKLNPPSESEFNLLTVKDKDRGFRLFEDGNSFATSSFTDMNMSDIAEKKSSFSFGKVEDHFEPVKQMRDFELKDFYDEIVNDMEDILLASGDAPVARYSQGSRMYEAHFSQPSRDGGSSASTSGTDYATNWIQQPLRIDNVEVVGARQIEGDVSMSERLVGVKKYTVYKIRVWSGEECWEVERRYREFSTLYQRLKKQFAVQGWTLPSPWSHVDRECRKLFGNASPDVIADRSVLIQECLQSVIASKFTSSSLNTLLFFLSKTEVVPDSPANNTNIPRTPFPNRVAHVENLTTLGKTISLNVQIRPFKSMKQMLDAQHYRCSGCHRNFDDGRTRVQEYFQVLGWGKPRLCEYSSQLFCSSCHNNDTAILPARVLHYWDFTRYPVSQMAKSYLDSIYDQPMLCVSAVNPLLFSKVPALQHVANIRHRIAAMLPHVRCPFRRSIDKGLGSRRYILDSNDFFALRDLIDLSKGIFSALPVMVETVSRKVHEHIVEQCLVCYDVGVPCNARQACNNPMSLIFPFQEEEIEKCRSCESVFHKNCFKTIVSCPCGAHFKLEALKQSAGEGIHVVKSDLNLIGRTTESGNGFISSLFSKWTPKISQNLGKNEPKDADNVILMGSLTNSSL